MTDITNSQNNKWNPNKLLFNYKLKNNSRVQITNIPGAESESSVRVNDKVTQFEHIHTHIPTYVSWFLKLWAGDCCQAFAVLVSCPCLKTIVCGENIISVQSQTHKKVRKCC